MPGNDHDVPTSADVTDRVGDMLAELDEADFERVEPPSGIWDDIQAVVSSGRARKPEHADEQRGLVVEYWLDADDVVSDVGQGWAQFAHDNGAPELAVPATERTLWSYFDHAEVRDLWQLVIAHVRTTQTAVQVPIRCDAPQARRWFEMMVTPASDGKLHFRSALVFEEARAPVALLDPDTERDDAALPIAVCSWCGRGRLGPSWLDIEALVSTGRLLERTAMPPISYGICAGCRDDMASELLVSDGARHIAD
ncbi:MAG TPA: hypothetical protein VMW08_04990 [Acidimicrobiales bacterium]|nr:hypothetical protein [Acidimicrobiales bacterium]